MTRLALATAVLLAVSGCGGPPSAPSQAALISPPPQNYRELISTKLRTVFRDADNVHDAQISTPFAFGSVLGSASMVCVKGTGLYQDAKTPSLATIAFTFRNSDLVNVDISHGLVYCRSADFEPFAGWQQLSDAPQPAPEPKSGRKPRGKGR